MASRYGAGIDGTHQSLALRRRREIHILAMRDMGATLAQIGAIYGISGGRVQQITRDVMRRARVRSQPIECRIDGPPELIYLVNSGWLDEIARR